MQPTMLKSITGTTKFIWLALTISCLNWNIADAFTPNLEQKTKPRYVSGVVSIVQDHAYIRTHRAPIYWKVSPYYLPQPTDSSCSLASATMVMNALRIPQMQYANQQLITTNGLMHTINPAWANNVKEGGNGVSLDQFSLFLNQALATYHILPIKLKVIHVTKINNSAVKFHHALMEGEKTGHTFIIVNFDQKFISGTKSVGHFAPVGAYDANTKRVLIMDPDRELFEPYWVPEQQLLKSMETKDSDARKNRGFIIVRWK